jgi:light-regulated signal transduction histidine kinase (bacteriophytochrome)
MIGALQDISEIKQANDELKSRSQFIQNIISNAIKYRRKGVDPIIKLDVNETDTHWKFVISDNGIGIADEYFERIFVIFQRLHNKEEYSGTRIGLAICKKIIENLGGKIWVESEENKGSRFLFMLPKKAQIPT